MCDGVGGIRGDAKHVDFTEGVLHIDVVEACAPKSYRLDAELCEAVDDGGTYRVVHEYANTVVSRSKLYRILCELGFKILEFYSVSRTVFVKGRPVVWLCIKKCNSHLFFLMFCSLALDFLKSL